jgi:hypothetical protein
MIDQGSTFVLATTVSGTHTVGSRTFGTPSRTAALMRFDAATLALEGVGVVEHRAGSVRSGIPGEVEAMESTGGTGARIAGELMGTMAFGPRELVAERYAFGMYIADVTFSP